MKKMVFCDYPIIQHERELPLFLLNMGLHKCQDHITRPEGYPCHQILYCTKGSGTLIFDKKSIVIDPNSAVYMPASYPHEYYPNEDIWDIHWIVPAGYSVDNILQHFGLCEPAVFELREVKALESIFRKMHEAIRADNVFGNYKASGYLYDFLIELYHQTAFAGVSAEPNPALIKAVDYIGNNYASQITMERLCAVSGVSKQYLCLLFRKIMNSRPMEYIAKWRIRAAKELLTGSDMTIDEIAEATGFCTASYFCKLFKRYEGITPSYFRKNV